MQAIKNYQEVIFTFFIPSKSLVSMCNLLLGYISIWTSHFSVALWSHVVSGHQVRWHRSGPYSSVVCGPAPWASPETLLERQLMRLHSRPTKSKSAFLGWLIYTLRLEKVLSFPIATRIDSPLTPGDLFIAQTEALLANFTMSFPLSGAMSCSRRHKPTWPLTLWAFVHVFL